MSWLDVIKSSIGGSWFRPDPSYTKVVDETTARVAGYASGLKDGRDEGYKKGYDATHETSEAAATSLKTQAQTELLYQMLAIIGQQYDGPISPGKVVDIIKGQGYAAGVAATTPAPSDSKLLTAVHALYTAAYWYPDRPCDAIALWTDVRDAAGLLASGSSPAPLSAEAIDTELSDIESTATTIEGILEPEEEAVAGVDQCQTPEQNSNPLLSAPSIAPSPTNLGESPDSSKPTNDSLSSSFSSSEHISVTLPLPVTKKRSRSNKPRKPRKLSQRKKKPTRN
jgi:hypothetical protein